MSIRVHVSVNVSILARVSMAVIKHHVKKQLGEERVYSTLSLWVDHGVKPGQELRAGMWRQELKHKACRTAPYWLVLCGFAHSNYGT